MRRGAAALLLLAVVACHARKGQSSAPVSPQSLYTRGWEALLRGDDKAAQQIAAEGRTRFAAQPQWRELFSVLEAEAVVKKDLTNAAAILERTSPTGEPRAAVRRLIALAATQDSATANKTLLEADALAARVMPELRGEIGARRALSLAALHKNGEAERCAWEAIRAATETKQTYALALAYLCLAAVEHDRSQAIEHYNLAAKYGHDSRYTRVEMVALNRAGWGYLEIGNLEQAWDKFTPVAAQDSLPEYQQPAVVQLGEIFVRRLEFDKALPYARRALAIAEKLGTPKELANSYQQLGQIELELGHYDAARNWTDRAEKTRPADDPSGALSDHFNEARILAATGDPARALTILESILASPYADAAMRWRAQGIAADIHGKLAHFSKAEQMYELTLATGGDERGKVVGTSLFAFERHFLSFYDNYIQLLLDEHEPARALQIAERSRARALRDAINLSSGNVIDPVALARRKNATILCYWLGAKRSLLWTVTPRGISVATLPADDVIDKAADAYRKELQSLRHKLADSTLGPDLYRMLVAPAGTIAPGSRVIVLPDAHLRALSFDALIVPSKPAHYWIEDVTISYSPSLQLTASLPSWKDTQNGRALVFGDVPAEGREFPRLKYAKKEVGEVAQNFGTRAVVRTGNDATPSAYTASASGFEFIHFAAHATDNAEKPLESAVILGRDATGFSLSGEQIVKVPIVAELVTVSSCNSAGRRNYAGEGLVGLAWAFLRAGAHRVVAAQWEVDDSAAPPMMKTMYQAIVRDGLDPAEALRRAKLALLHSNTTHERPLYWAPFFIYGAI